MIRFNPWTRGDQFRSDVSANVYQTFLPATAKQTKRKFHIFLLKLCNSTIEFIRSFETENQWEAICIRFHF